METATLVSLISLALTIIIGFCRVAFKGGRISRNLEQVEKNYNDIKYEVDCLHDSVLEIQTIIRNNGTELLSLIKRHSPRMLNELGEKLFNDMNGSEFIEKNKERLFAGIDKRHPQTALDVERVSRIVCLELAEDSIFNPIKDFVYNCPSEPGKDIGITTKIDMTLDMACAILALPLRDAYLQKHPELDPNRQSATEA